MIKNSLVGYTGFVGSNLCSDKTFDMLYNSKNIEEAFDTKPENLIYSGIPAQKFIANKFPEKDFEIVKQAINNIERIKPKNLILISTIDVYKNPVNVDEDSEIKEKVLEPYGKNRYYLEKWVKENFENYLIIHLPALYGKNIKKNFIYDLIHVIPSMIKEEKFEQIVKRDGFIKAYYEKQENGFYKYTNTQNEKNLRDYFEKIGFSALNFTDSRANYQFYNLAYLNKHIKKAMENNIKILNLAVEPVNVSELYKFIKKKEFCNEVLENIPNYNFKTKYAEIFGGKNGYIFDKNFVLNDIKKFVESGK